MVRGAIIFSCRAKSPGIVKNHNASNGGWMWLICASESPGKRILASQSKRFKAAARRMAAPANQRTIRCTGLKLPFFMYAGEDRHMSADRKVTRLANPCETIVTLPGINIGVLLTGCVASFPPLTWGRTKVKPSGTDKPNSAAISFACLLGFQPSCRRLR